MFRPIFLLLLAALPVLAWGQEVTLPQTVSGEVGTFIEVKAKTDDLLVKWKSVDAGLMLFPAHLLKDSKTAVVLAMKDGRYRILAVSAKDGTPSDYAECWVIVGTPGPGPAPVPPGPGPEPPKPEPPPLPPPAPGPRQVLILHESGDDNPAMSRLLVSMAATKGREYLKSKGHVYFNFDVDGKRADGTPDPNVQAWKVALNIRLPALAILDTKGTVLHKASLSDAPTTDEVLEMLKQWEGK